MKHFTDSNMLVTRMAVPQGHPSTTENYFAEVLSRWQNEPWVKYLYKYGNIDNGDTYKSAENFETVYVLKWSIDSHRKTMFLLQWAEQLDKIYR
jgi:hypothetical protein